jgi:hypothetical protein
MTPYESACAAIDRATQDDPRALEEPYSRRMVEETRRLAPRASEELLLAARAQHLRRWTIPRARYPEGRMGYLAWREMLKKFHAGTVAGIMKDAGYGEESIATVGSLMVRKNTAADPEGQTLEDAACLVFLQFEFAEFAAKTAPDKVVDILRKTWRKMSAQARERALAVDYGKDDRRLIEKALAPPSPAG